jgi:glutaredoxin-like protein NrdH
MLMAENVQVTHVPGKKTKKLMLYALSTCPWCQKTKMLLNQLGVEYDFTDVDLLQGPARAEAIKTISKFNPSSSFPTLVIDDARCIVGFKEDDIRAALK